MLENARQPPWPPFFRLDLAHLKTNPGSHTIIRWRH